MWSTAKFSWRPNGHPWQRAISVTPVTKKILELIAVDPFNHLGPISMRQLFDSHQTVPDYPANIQTSKIERDSLAVNLNKDYICRLIDKAARAWRLHTKNETLCSHIFGCHTDMYFSRDSIRLVLIIRLAGRRFLIASPPILFAFLRILNPATHDHPGI